MSVSLTKTYAPGTVVRIVGAGQSENGILGYVCRTKPTNGDEVYVGVISQPATESDFFRLRPNQRLSYGWRHLAPEAQ